MSEFIALLVRFVVAVESIAASMSGKSLEKATDPEVNGTKDAKRTTTTRSRSKAKEGPEDDQQDEPEEKKPATRARKPAADKAKTTSKSKPKGDDDLDELRDEIQQIATHIAKGESDDCANEFDDLLDKYEIKNVKRLADADVADFHADLKDLAERYYDLEEAA